MSSPDVREYSLREPIRTVNTVHRQEIFPHSCRAFETVPYQISIFVIGRLVRRDMPSLLATKLSAPNLLGQVALALRQLPWLIVFVHCNNIHVQSAFEGMIGPEYLPPSHCPHPLLVAHTAIGLNADHIPKYSRPAEQRSVLEPSFRDTTHFTPEYSAARGKTDIMPRSGRAEPLNRMLRVMTSYSRVPRTPMTDSCPFRQCNRLQGPYFPVRHVLVRGSLRVVNHPYDP